MAEQNPSHVPTQSQDSQLLKDLKKSVQGISGVQNRQNDVDNLQPETHKRKKRRLHKKKVRKHSPQYYEEKRLKKIQKKRELNWDSHFINEEIPDILQRKRPKTRLDHKKQFERYKISKQQLLHPALSLKKGMKLPQIERKNQTTKSFKIRVVNKKVQANIDEKLEAYEKKDIKSKFVTPNQNPKQRHSVKKTTQNLKKIQNVKQSNTVNIQKVTEQKESHLQSKHQTKQIQKTVQKLQNAIQFPKIQEEKNNAQEKQANFIINQNPVQNKTEQSIKKEQKGKIQQKKQSEVKVKQQKKQGNLLQLPNNNRKTQQKSQKVKQKSLKVIQKQQTKRQTSIIKSSKAVQPIAKQQKAKKQKQSKKDQIKKQFRTQKKFQKTSKDVITATQLNKGQNANNAHKVQKRQTKLQSLTRLYRQKIQTIQKSLNSQQQFPPCHKQLLESFFPFLQNKKVKSTLDQQLEAIKNRKSLVSAIKKSLQNRQRQIAKIKQAIEANVQSSKLPFLIIDDYRTATLVCIQDLLKWKEHWQNIYKDLTKKTKSVDYLRKGQKYLLKIIQSVDFVSKEGHKKDPFLISIYALNQQQRQIILKIRACELLLLEEQFNNLSQTS